MHQIKLLLRASTPLYILLFFRFTGTTKAEYEANFRKVSGEVKGPYILLFENFDLVTNDSLRGGDDAFSEFQSLLIQHDLDRAYRNFQKEVKKHDMSWRTNLLDSLGTLPTEEEWEALKAKEERFVYISDTIFHSDSRYPIDIPVKLGVYRSISARVFFSLGNFQDKLQLIFPDKKDEDDPYGLKKRIRMSVGGQATKAYLNLQSYDEQLRKFITPHRYLTAKRLNSKALNGRAYKVWDAKDQLIFEDDAGLEGLQYQTNETGLINVLSGEGNERFILWYDHWYMYLLMGIQLILYIGLLMGWKDPKKVETSPEVSE